MTDRVDFFKHDLGEPELASLQQTLGSLFLTGGPRVVELEDRLARLTECDHAIAVSSCTTGLFLSLRAFDVGPGDEVVTTPMTYVATSNAVLHTGADVVFADVDPKTGLLDPTEVEAKITRRTKAIIVVHLYGHMADMRSFVELSERHGIALIEDAAHTIIAERDGFVPGSASDAAVFSFYATKNITSGDGGAIITKHAHYAERLRRLRNHGVSKDVAARHGDSCGDAARRGSYQHWDMVELGYKANLTDIQAALLIPQLGRLVTARHKRQKRVEQYEARLAARQDVHWIGWLGKSSHHLLPVLVPLGSRDSVLAGLSERGIGCAVNYRAIHTLSYYRERLGLAPEALPKAFDFGQRTLSLPLWPDLPLSDVDRAAEALCRSLD